MGLLSSKTPPEEAAATTPEHQQVIQGGSSDGLILSGSDKNATNTFSGRQPSVRVKSKYKQPMPEHNELERRFAKVLASMDLPPDKAKLLKNYDYEKKWDIICDQEMVHAKDPPAYYLNKLRTYLDPKASRSHRKRKMVGESTSTQVLRDLEISLRTNHIEWVREFLNEENLGLDVLIDYLHFRLGMLRHEQRVAEYRSESQERLNPVQNTTLVLNTPGGLSAGSTTTGSTLGIDRTSNISSLSGVNGYLLRTPLDGSSVGGTGAVADSPSIKRRSKHVAKLNMGESKDDIHVCIMCMRAIMNNKYGFNMVIQHREAINCIALSLTHKSLRTKALVLELLAAICLVKGGHAIILAAFASVKDTLHERHRFQTLMTYFLSPDMFHIEFMVACMQFVNIVVHSVEDMNFRLHLQYEFTMLGLDGYLATLRRTESEELQVQISAYLDNVFDVHALMEDSETKTAALEKAAELEEELGQAHDRLHELESASVNKLLELEGQIASLCSEREQLLGAVGARDEEVSTLRRAAAEQQSRQSLLDEKLLQLETITRSLPKGATIAGLSDLLSSSALLSPPSSSTASTPSLLSPPSHAASPPPPPPPPPNHQQSPPPPPPPAPPAPPIPPPPPHMKGSMGYMSSFHPMAPQVGCGVAPDGAMTIKRKVLTKYKLPTINWIALKPNQVRGTIFNELDDDKLYPTIDFVDFEEKFKIGNAGMMMNGDTAVDGLQSMPSKRFKKPENVTLLEHTRLRNIAISRRKLDMVPDKVVQAINHLDLKLLPLESVELLQRMVPTEQEVKAYREFQNERRDVNLLTDEDRFLMQLARVERISSKLGTMNYIGNFYDNIHLIAPQINAIISGSNSVKDSRKLRSILEIILAFGNYMNSSRRGPAYGFRLQSLDSLLDTKSTDKRMCLLHYIAGTVRHKFPDLLGFETELMYIEKAAVVSLENITTDVQDLEKGMESVRKESDLRSRGTPGTNSGNTGTPSPVLRDFLANAEEKLRRVKNDAKIAQDAFRECVEYFAESPRTTDANTFFSMLVRFCKAFKSADQENEQRKRLEMAALNNNTNEDINKKNKINAKKQQEAVINELKTKTRMVKEKKLLQQDEVYNGALEDILLGLKSEPYRRADAVRRSQRRRIDSNRLSKTMEEIEI